MSVMARANTARSPARMPVAKRAMSMAGGIGTLRGLMEVS
jgi:hypothetical protein